MQGDPRPQEPEEGRLTSVDAQAATDEELRAARRAAVSRRLLTEITWPVVRDAIERGSGIIVPIGSCEQHGYHMPLVTDTLLATELAVCAADRLDYLVAPPSNYGFRSRPLSGGGPTYPGTISLSATTLIGVVTDVVSELIRFGFKRIVLLSMHIENTNMLYEGAWQALRGHEQDVRIMVVEQGFAAISEKSIDVLFEGEFPGWDVEHAGVMETSLMLYLHPELVHMDRAVDDKAERTAHYEVLPVPSEMITVSGGLWKSSPGSAAKGRVVWEELVDYLEGAIQLEMA
jgi:creatinine amidohydrolase